MSMMLHGKVYLNLVLLMLPPNFVAVSRLELVHKSLLINIKLSRIHFHGFQLLPAVLS